MIKYIVFFIFSTSLFAADNSYRYFQPTNKEYFGQYYGKNSLKRINIIINKLKKSKKLSLSKQFESINNLFNKFTYLADNIHWHKSNHWASPLEFIGTNAGDSEDFALIKYVALISLGIKKEKLKLMQYKNNKNFVDKSGEYIVLAYFHRASKNPIIFDKVNKKLRQVDVKKLEYIKIIDNTNFWNKYFNIKSNSITTINGKKLSKIFKLIPSSKLKKQWKRIFKKEKRLKKYHLETLTKKQQKNLLSFLIKYSADSDQVETAGY